MLTLSISAGCCQGSIQSPCWRTTQGLWSFFSTWIDLLPFWVPTFEILGMRSVERNYKWARTLCGAWFRIALGTSWSKRSKAFSCSFKSPICIAFWLYYIFYCFFCSFTIKQAGKRLILITNSDYHYTNKMMQHAFNRFLPDAMDWRALFDMVRCL